MPAEVIKIYRPAEVTGLGGKAVAVRREDDGTVVLAIVGPKGAIQARIWLAEAQAARVATAIMEATPT